MEGEDFTSQAISLIQRIPRGKVATYGQIADLAGNRRGARMVVRILNSSSEKYDLPWHRIVNRQGQISLPRGNGYELQKELLEKEGVVFDSEDTIDLRRYLWQEQG
jgi:methylated-DNA-protein-cysteine methyltransferase-like protein